MNTSCQYVVVIRLQDLYSNCATVVEYMWGYAIPVLAVFVIVINSLIVTVLAKPHVRSHTTLILTLIACSDTLNIVFPSISYVYHYASGRFKNYLRYSSCLWTYILADICVDMFNMIPLWLTVLLAYIRCRCLRSPFKSRHIHSYKNIVIYLLVILLLAIFVHLPSFFHFTFTPVVVKDDSTNKTEVACGVSETVYSILQPCSGRKIHLLMETLIDSFIPCVILMTCNISILITLRKAKRDRRFLRSHSSSLKGFQRKSDKEGGSSSPTGKDDGIVNEISKRDLIDGDRNGFKSTSTRSETKYCGANKTGKSTRPLLTVTERCKGFKKKTRISDVSFDKLDKESRRTTWFIFVISTMILLHEIPLVVVNIYNLIIHVNEPLPLSYYGCFNMILALWQYLTYPTIFLIYACMSGSFRTEFMNVITNSCKQRQENTCDSKKMFLSPCSVRKCINRDHTNGDQSGLHCDFDTGI